MAIKDIFTYSARWDSVGLGCYCCANTINDQVWPNVDRNYGCSLHQRLLTVELNERDYLEEEWFCKQFENNGQAFSEALKTFALLKSSLNDEILYCCCGKEYLKEIPFANLPKL